VTVEGPCFIDEGSTVKAGARIGPYAVIGRNCHVEEQATIQESIVWANTRVCQEASVRASILGRNCHVGRSASVLDGVVLGDKSVVTEFSKL
jgi:NDP-sugar pyrophosphorylase family protein